MAVTHTRAHAANATSHILIISCYMYPFRRVHFVVPGLDAMVERRVAVKGGGEVDLDEEKREKRKKRGKRGKRRKRTTRQRGKRGRVQW